MNCIMFQNVIWTPARCCILNSQRYLHNQILITNWLIWLDDLSKISSLIVLSLPLTFLVINCMIVGNSTTWNQLEAGLIMVRAMKSINEPSIPLSVYRPMRSTQRASHGVLITILGGKCPYFCVHFFLFTWQVLFWIGMCFSYLSSIIPARQVQHSGLF